MKTVGIARTVTGGGYWLVDSDGGVYCFGDAAFYGSCTGMRLNKPVVGIAATPGGQGYWLTAADGGVFTFGDAGFFGSMGGQLIYKPVVGITATPTGLGYWLAAADGGVFSFGDAEFFGSMGGQWIYKPVVGLTATPTGQGYWLTAEDGGVFTFGDAGFFGSMGGQWIYRPVVGISATPSGQGYWLTAADGGVFSFGDAEFFGSMGGQWLYKPVVGITATPSGQGYWLVAEDGGVFTFGDAAFSGSGFLEPRDERTCVILCQFRNADGTLSPVVADHDFYLQFFMGRNIGGSLRDYFAEVTHGRVQIVGEVFGWMDIGHTIEEHNAPVTVPSDQRRRAFNWGIEAARNAGIAVDGFMRQVVIINQDTDWGGVSIGRSMILPDTQTSPWSHSRAAHEFGHVLGLDDSFNTTNDNGISVDTRYQDKHCIMSYATSGARFSLPLLGKNLEAGPGLNGVYTYKLNGIPASRLAVVPATGAAITLTLAPLTHPDESGFLLVQIPPGPGRPNTYWVELHDNSNWDRSIANSQVAVHETRDGDGGSYALQEYGLQSLTSPDDPAFLTPDRSIGIRFVEKTGICVSVRIWELSPGPLPNIYISSIVFDPPGDEVAGENVVIRNDFFIPMSLFKWRLHDDTNHPLTKPWTYEFPNIMISPGEDITVWTGSGRDDVHNLHWGLNHPVWNNTGGDTAVLTDNQGNVVSRLSY